MNIQLDPKIRDWVFLPMIYVTTVVSIIRTLYGLYSKYTASKEVIKNKQKFLDTADKKLLARCDRLTRSGMLLTDEAFDSRRTFLCKQNGYLDKRGQKKAQTDMTKMMMDSQTAMFSGMKDTIGMGVAMMLQMAWVNYFFSGFILAKVPFPLTQKFRGMMQNGIDIDSLDVRFVSGLSFYFIVMFGMSELQSLLINQEQFKLSDEDSLEQAQLQAQKQSKMGGQAGMMGGKAGMMGGGMPMMMPWQQNTDQSKQFTEQSQSLKLVYHTFRLKKCDQMALARLRGKLS